mgnify:CR=1 FL=1
MGYERKLGMILESPGPKVVRNKNKSPNSIIENTIESRAKFFSTMDKILEELKKVLNLRVTDMLRMQLAKSTAELLYISYIRHENGFNVDVVVDPFDGKIMFPRSGPLNFTDRHLALAARFIDQYMQQLQNCALEDFREGVNIPQWAKDTLDRNVADGLFDHIEDFDEEEEEEYIVEDDDVSSSEECNCPTCRGERRLLEEEDVSEDDFLRALPAWAKGKPN